MSPGADAHRLARNADVKGQHEAEYAWFVISDSLPGLSTSAENAARQIVEACRYGDPELTITLPARIAMMANNVAPAPLPRAMVLANRLLPGPNGADGERPQTGAGDQVRSGRRRPPRCSPTARRWPTTNCDPRLRTGRTTSWACPL